MIMNPKGLISPSGHSASPAPPRDAVQNNSARAPLGSGLRQALNPSTNHDIIASDALSIGSDFVEFSVQHTVPPTTQFLFPSLPFKRREKKEKKTFSALERDDGKALSQSSHQMRSINLSPPVQQVPLIISPLSVNYISLPFLDNHCYFRVSVMHPRGGWRCVDMLEPLPTLSWKKRCSSEGPTLSAVVQ